MNKRIFQSAAALLLTVVSTASSAGIWWDSGISNIDGVLDVNSGVSENFTMAATNSLDSLTVRVQYETGAELSLGATSIEFFDGIPGTQIGSTVGLAELTSSAFVGVSTTPGFGGYSTWDLTFDLTSAGLGGLVGGTDYWFTFYSAAVGGADANVYWVDSDGSGDIIPGAYGMFGPYSGDFAFALAGESTLPPEPVPSPAPLALLALGILGLLAARRK